MFSDRIRLYSTILKWLLRLHSSNILYQHNTNKGPTWGRPIGDIRRRIQPVCSKEAPTKARGPKEGAAQEGREGSRGLGTMGSLAKGLSHGATYGPFVFLLRLELFGTGPTIAFRNPVRGFGCVSIKGTRPNRFLSMFQPKTSLCSGESSDFRRLPCFASHNNQELPELVTWFCNLRAACSKASTTPRQGLYNLGKASENHSGGANDWA